MALTEWTVPWTVQDGGWPARLCPDSFKEAVSTVSRPRCLPGHAVLGGGSTVRSSANSAPSSWELSGRMSSNRSTVRAINPAPSID
jgi:hypothetical protein